MPDIIAVDLNDITNLSPGQLHLLLECLLDNEVRANGIPASAVNVMLDINVPDEGKDGLVHWEGSPHRTQWIPHRRTLFQSKAGDFRSAVGELFVRKSRRKLIKPAVKENFDNGGAYVLFCGGRTLADRTKTNAIAAMKVALRPFYGERELRIEIKDRNDIRKWTNRYVSAISLVLRANSKHGLETFMTWARWKDRTGPQGEFQWSGQASEHVNRIRASFAGKGQVQRIVGFSGLGKTRIAFEAFRPPRVSKDDPAQAALSGSVVYVRATEDLIDVVAQLQSRDVSGTIVVDDCNEALHEELAGYIGTSKLNLLTLDYHLDDELRNPQAGVFQLNTSPFETIRAILKQSHPTLSDANIDIIASYADGFPKIAALLRDVPLEEDIQLGPLTDKHLTDRLLWGRNPQDELARKVVEACSLFVHLGFTGRFAYQRDYVAATICNMSSSEFYRKAGFFRPRGVVDQIGDFVRVSPLPLAIRLSENWWTREAPERTTAIFNDPNMPDALKDALGRQFTNLSGVERANEIARRLVGPAAPFGRAEVLNTAQGSRVFRSLAQVNPEAAIETLIREFGGVPVERLREQVGPGRRYLVWALEGLVFHESIFTRAAPLLSLLALAENEKIGNNATAQYLQLFQPYLAGTEAPPSLRIDEIDRCLASGNPALVELAIRAAGRAISVASNGRTMGAEVQGRTILEDWKPQTWEDLFSYFNAAIDRLIPLAKRDDAQGQQARKRLGSAIRNLVGRVDVERIIREVTSSYRGAWPEALDNVRMVLRFDLKGLDFEKKENRDFRDTVASWLTLLQPSDESARLRLIVSIPPFGNMEEGEDGTYVDLNERDAAALAEQFVDDPTTWKTVLVTLSVGEQRQGYTFGRRIGELLDPQYQPAYVSSAFEALEGAGDQGNPVLLCGLLAAVKTTNRELVESTLERIAESENTYRYIIYFTAWTDADQRDLDRITSLLRAGRLEPDSYRAFIPGRVLKRFDAATVCRFLDPLLDYGVRGAFAALQVASMYATTDDEQSGCEALFRKILLTEGMLSWKTHDTMDRYSLEQTIRRLLDAPRDESELAQTLTGQIVGACRDPELDIMAYEIMQPVIVQLLKRYPAVSWPLLKAAFAHADALTTFHLIHVMSRSLVMEEGPKSAFLLLSNEDLLQWCAEQPELAPRLVLQSIPLFSYDGSAIVVPELVEQLITLYGADPRVRSVLGGSLESFGFVGSLVPAYEQRLGFAKHFSRNRVPEVAAWAAEYASRFEERVESQKKRDAEHKQGILTPFYADELPIDERPADG